MLIPPLVVKQGPDDQCYLLQKVLPSLTDKSIQRSVPLKYHLFDMHNTRPWGLFAEKPHCLDWSNPGTFFGLFAFGFNPMEKIKSSVTLLVEQFMQECRKKGISNAVMPTSEIVRRTTQFHLWGLIDKEVVLMHQGVMKHISAHDSRLPLIRLWARMVATLEMIAKDPQAVIVVRKGNREDFASCLKLLERITLPVYYGIQLDTPLFPDYTAIEPTLGWHVLD